MESAFNTLHPYNKDIEYEPNKTNNMQFDMEYKINWNDSSSVKRIKDSIQRLLSKSLIEGLKEDDISSLFRSSSEIIESLRFGQLSDVCDVAIDRFGRRSYHYVKKAIDYYDKNIQKETKNIISSLTAVELNRLNTKLNHDIKQNNSQHHPQFYAYFTHIIEDTIKGSTQSTAAGQIETIASTRNDDSKQRVSNDGLAEAGKTYKLQEIIGRKDEEIQRMININFEEKGLVNDIDINQCFLLLNSLTNSLMKRFELKYRKNVVDAIGDKDINNLLDANSEFNQELNKYSETMMQFGVFSDTINKSIDDIKEYIHNKYAPNVRDYKEWTLDDFILWIKCLENGRYIKYLDRLLLGFTECAILPDLCTADLAVPPFNIKRFKDKRDLIKHFKNLRCQYK